MGRRAACGRLGEAVGADCVRAGPSLGRAACHAGGRLTLRGGGPALVASWKAGKQKSWKVRELETANWRGPAGKSCAPSGTCWRRADERALCALLLLVCWPPVALWAQAGEFGAQRAALVAVRRAKGRSLLRARPKQSGPKGLREWRGEWSPAGGCQARRARCSLLAARNSKRVEDNKGTRPPACCPSKRH